MFFVLLWERILRSLGDYHKIKKSRRIRERLGFLQEGCIRNSHYLHNTYMHIMIDRL